MHRVLCCRGVECSTFLCIRWTKETDKNKNASDNSQMGFIFSLMTSVRFIFHCSRTSEYKSRIGTVTENWLIFSRDKVFCVYLFRMANGILNRSFLIGGKQISGVWNTWTTQQQRRATINENNNNNKYKLVEDVVECKWYRSCHVIH